MPVMALDEAPPEAEIANRNAEMICAGAMRD
jgi:hypothetical protein